VEEQRRRQLSLLYPFLPSVSYVPSPPLSLSPPVLSSLSLFPSHLLKRTISLRSFLLQLVESRKSRAREEKIRKPRGKNVRLRHRRRKLEVSDTLKDSSMVILTSFSVSPSTRLSSSQSLSRSTSTPLKELDSPSLLDHTDLAT